MVTRDGVVPRLGVWSLIRSDYRRYAVTGAPLLAIILLTQGFWASCTYRVCHALVRTARPRALRVCISLFANVACKLMEVLTGVSLPATVRAGKGLYIGHFGCIIIHPDTVIGSNCNISQCVTIGAGGRGDSRGVPELGDRVYVGPGACIFGKITVGSDSAIGAGAVVTHSVPPGSVAVGVPASVVSARGSFEFITYDGKPAEPTSAAPH